MLSVFVFMVRKRDEREGQLQEMYNNRKTRFSIEPHYEFEPPTMYL